MILAMLKKAKWTMISVLFLDLLRKGTDTTYLIVLKVKKKRNRKVYKSQEDERNLRSC